MVLVVKQARDSIPYTDGYDFPVGKPDAVQYYNAQVFGKNNHLGDDWNGRGGGNTDLGDPIYSIAHGVVASAQDEGVGWGKVIRIIHINRDGSQIESLYAHCNEMMVKSGDCIRRGDLIGTIGNAGGAYLAHLHFELRSEVGMPLGGGYSRDRDGYLDPTAYIDNHRP